MNHFSIANALAKKFDTRRTGLGRARLEMFKMGLKGQDIIKVSQILNQLK